MYIQEGGMRTKLVKWGNSLGLRIPKVFAKDLGLDEGSEIDLILNDGCVVITPVHPRTLELADLLAGITGDNLHGETDTGDAVGGESW